MQRLNVFGLSDVVIRPAGDLSGNQFILVEIAGANEDEVKELLAKQGKFEARIGNETVFTGGERDISSVCRGDPTCAYIEQCQQSQGGYFCNFRFEIFLSEDAAKRHAEISKKCNFVGTSLFTVFAIFNNWGCWSCHWCYYPN